MRNEIALSEVSTMQFQLNNHTNRYNLWEPVRHWSICETFFFAGGLREREKDLRSLRTIVVETTKVGNKIRD